MIDLCPHVQPNTSAFCSGGLYRMEACIPVESAGIWTLKDCDTMREFFKDGPGLWTNLISVFEFEGSPWNKSIRTHKVIHTGSCQINSLSMIFRNIGWSSNVPSTWPNWSFGNSRWEFSMISVCMYKRHLKAMNHMPICSQRKTSMRFKFDSLVRLFVYVMQTTFSYYPSLAASQACNTKPEAV